jgi:hypothetical protein
MHMICLVHMFYVCLDKIHTDTSNTYMHFQIHTRYAHAGSLMFLACAMTYGELRSSVSQ